MSEKVTTLPKQAVSIETIVLVGIFTALSAVISALPIGIKILGVPATLQTFAMAFLGFALGPVLGTASCGVYILMGLIGLPVYNGYTSGPGVLFGVTGGFLFGFLFLSFLSGIGMKFTKKDYYPVLKNIIVIVFSLIGLLICHLLGSAQFSVLCHKTFSESFLLVSLPYIPKDIISVILAYVIAVSVRTALSKAKLLPESIR